MNICILSRSLPCHFQGGLEYHTMTLTKCLAKRGHQIVILTTGHEKDIPCPFQNDAIEILHLPSTKPAQYNFPYFINTAREIIRNKKIDIVHSQGYAAFGYMFYKTKPLLTTIHGTLTSETNLFYSNKWQDIWKHKNRLISLPLQKQLLNRSDMMSVDSEFTRNLLLAEYPRIHKKISKIPLGIDINFFTPIAKQEAKKQLNLPDKFTILTLGRITESKGFQIVIRALAQLKELDISLVIAGTGPYKPTLESMVISHQLSNVKFLGNVDENIKPVVYSAADLFIHPDLTAPAFGLVIVEALACGTPVIASHSGALPEIVSPDTGFLFDRSDINQLLTLIKICLDKNSLVQEMSMEARKRAERLFSAEKMTDQMESMYQKVVSDNP